jgi:hypothetical protein
MFGRVATLVNVSIPLESFLFGDFGNLPLLAF